MWSTLKAGILTGKYGNHIPQNTRLRKEENKILLNKFNKEKNIINNKITKKSAEDILKFSLTQLALV